ncbi:heparan-alpha-glucosaminide N-acetyltransferase domain-containing protein [Aureibacter tunicatorum]|uniref:Protein-S-isoprenylcysteine O-methyltransferase Ste14 n=1 Tax=Aureibacter tunicatorum TaxID=866807 RepID=A0AAE3XP35_9BACT|nr:heparan-alpha-glucosaminide N-acetyltransferase domain-containing protein [Aureibacter tunicatorum]MDR6239326.1 protein-S-isoprenylcysteine O-methyltransferase Ste14 [Aureibacter tunicatorum]BDD04751.1 membrane protein [Aureibacter tunicatorum]
MIKKTRIASIDIFRALTMLFMIWVNDFPTLTGIPKWLKHGPSGEEYIGFSDFIFPLFLFIVGLSIPFAIQHRLNKSVDAFEISKHIVLRSASLLLIGVYMVNYETSHHESLSIGTYWWCILMATGVVLIWMDWKRSPVPEKFHKLFQGIGIAIWIYLAIIYKGGEDGTLGMSTQWWGILGLIGWAYLINALSFILFRGNFIVISLIFILFNALAVLNFAGYFESASGFITYFSTIYGGFIPAFTSAGLIGGLLLKQLTEEKQSKVVLTMIGLGLINIIYGLLMESHFWMIYKLGISIGVGFISFAIIYWLVDIKNKTSWAKIIAPAGTATLTCYLFQYFEYPLRMETGFRLPEIMNTGTIGLIVSFIISILIVVFTGWLEKKGFKLKL